MKRAAILALAGGLGACAAAPASVAPTRAKVAALVTSSSGAAARAPAHADAPPAFPAGWARGAAASPMGEGTAPPPLSFAQLHVNEAPPRPVLAPVAIPFGDLPVAEVVPSPSSDKPPKSPPTGPLATELTVTPECRRAVVRGHAFGWLHVGYVDQPIAQPEGGGVPLWELRGNRGKPGYLLASWGSLDAEADGAVHYRHTVAWIDRTTCEARVARSIALIPLPLGGGAAYAFVERCPTCAIEARETLRVVFPRSEWREAPIGGSEAPIGRGAGRKIVLTVTAAALREHRKSGVRVAIDRDVAIGIEVVHGTGEAEPSVIAYASDTPPNLRGF